MAIATLNPLIKSLSGRRENFVFYQRQGKTFIRIHVMPANPDTIAQRIVRRTFAEAVKSWQSLTDEEKDAFNRKARNLNMSGYNLHISQFMKERHQNAVSRNDFHDRTINCIFNRMLPEGNTRRFPSVSYSNINRFAEKYSSSVLQNSPG